MPTLSHLISRTPTKPNLYFANPLVTVVSEPDLYRLLKFYVPNLMSLSLCLGCTNGSVQVWDNCILIVIRPVCMVRSCWHFTQHPRWRTTPCRLSVTAYSIYLQLPSILEATPPSTTWGRAMPWWKGPTYHGFHCYSRVLTKHIKLPTQKVSSLFHDFTNNLGLKLAGTDGILSTCGKVYNGQTGAFMKIRVNEHHLNIKL